MGVDQLRQALGTRCGVASPRGEPDRIRRGSGLGNRQRGQAQPLHLDLFAAESISDPGRVVLGQDQAHQFRQPLRQGKMGGDMRRGVRAGRALLKKQVGQAAVRLDDRLVVHAAADERLEVLVPELDPLPDEPDAGSQSLRERRHLLDGHIERGRQGGHADRAGQRQQEREPPFSARVRAAGLQPRREQQLEHLLRGPLALLQQGRHIPCFGADLLQGVVLRPWIAAATTVEVQALLVGGGGPVATQMRGRGLSRERRQRHLRGGVGPE
ncbi:hypothetical protein [Streptomyces mutabilis]|uniref:hypothetical protein n=1 Tax=Streptomyces mutabilis TaxID=67332 RepID=UPI00369ACFC2